MYLVPLLLSWSLLSACVNQLRTEYILFYIDIVFNIFLDIQKVQVL